MGRIIRNGIEYGSGNENATNINYDGSVSGLEATTVQEAIDEMAESLGGIEFAIVDGKPQWKERGADSFSPFNSGEVETIVIGSNTSFSQQTFDVKSLLPNDYTRLTSDDFYFTNLSITTVKGFSSSNTTTPLTVSYDASTGILTVSMASSYVVINAVSYAAIIQYTVNCMLK